MTFRSFLWTLLAVVALASHPVKAAERTLGLVTYTAPAGWQVEDKTGGTGTVAQLLNLSTTSFCLIWILPATPATGELEESFTAQWTALWTTLRTFAKVDAPTPKTQRIGNSTAAIGGAASTAVGGTPAYLKLLVLDAGASVVPMIIMAPSAALLSTYDAEVNAMLSSLFVERAESLPTRISELVGDWEHSDGMNETYVDRYTGAYAGTNSLHYREGWKFTVQGGFSSDFFGLQNGKRISEKSTGTAVLKGNILTLKTQNTAIYVLRGWHSGPGGTVMTLNGPWYEHAPPPLDILANPEQGRNLDKRYLRKR